MIILMASNRLERHILKILPHVSKANLMIDTDTTKKAKVFYILDNKNIALELIIEIMVLKGQMQIINTLVKK